MDINVIGGTLSENEIEQYKKHAEELYAGQALMGMDITVDGEFVDIAYRLQPVPFERIRRITGYLVGTLDNWNTAKKAEESDRVKHSFAFSDFEKLH